VGTGSRNVGTGSRNVGTGSRNVGTGSTECTFLVTFFIMFHDVFVFNYILLSVHCSGAA